MLRVVSGKWRGAKLQEVDRDQTRPTTDRNKETLFNILGQYFPGGMALDLFSGSGALGIEALSRGVEKCIFVDNSPLAIQTARKNLARFALGDAAQVLHQDVFAFIDQYSGPGFCLILIDPPYRLDDHNRLLELIARKKLLEDEGDLVIETGKDTFLEDHFPNLVKTREYVSGITKFTFYTTKEEQQ